jgi:hypothetical protein
MLKRGSLEEFILFFPSGFHYVNTQQEGPSKCEHLELGFQSQSGEK